MKRQIEIIFYLKKYIRKISNVLKADTDAPSEEKDRFVAHLYKFMEERGTPLNKVPMCAGKELNLYGVYRIVQKLGGYNKVLF